MKQALILIDLQNDFCPGGALAVNDGDAVIAVANRLAAAFHQRGEPVVATQDWHPADHGSFASVSGEAVNTVGELNGLPQIWWPDHAVQESHGADFHPALQRELIEVVFHKGEQRDIDSYSAFSTTATGARPVWMPARARITRLVMMGLATDYCVKFSVLDALQLGYEVEVISEGCRGVNLQPQDSVEALAQMAASGALIR